MSAHGPDSGLVNGFCDNTLPVGHVCALVKNQALTRQAGR